MSQSVYSQKQRKLKKADTKTRSERTTLRPGTSDSATLSMIGGGSQQPMSLALREKFEPAFNADFSNIRISRGKIPSEFGAEAFARGTDIHLDSEVGDDVLGHELAHVVQQASGRVVPGGFPLVESASLEHEADVLGERAAVGGQARGGDFMNITPLSSVSAPVQAKSKEEKEQEKAAKKAGNKGQGTTSSTTAPPRLASPPTTSSTTAPPRLASPPTTSSTTDRAAEEKKAKLKAKRPWELTKAELEANRFNPNQDDDLQAQLKGIDEAADPRSATQLFQKYSGNESGKVLDESDGDWDMGGNKTDPALIKTRLKNMTRMLRDYPELKGKIGNFTEDTDEGTSMSATNTLDGGKSDISWNISSMGKGEEAAKEREKAWEHDKSTYFSAASTDYDGNHELGHTLNSLLIEKNNPDLNKREKDWAHNITADKITQEAAGKAGLTVNKLTAKTKHQKAGQLDMSTMHGASKADSATSKYGTQDSGELFAEAFADVYENGEDAKPLHKEIVKLYESKRG